MDCGSPFARHLVGDPIDVVTGAATDRALDFTLDGPIAVKFFRFYDSRWCRDDRGLGLGHRHGFEHWLVFDLDGVVYREPDGSDHRFLHFTHDGHVQTSGGYRLVRLDEERFELTRHAKPTLRFRRPAGALDAELTEWLETLEGRQERLTFVHDGARLSQVLAPNDQTLTLVWADDGHLAGVRGAGRGVDHGWLIRYAYDGPRLATGTDAYKTSFHLAYDDHNRVSRRTDRRGYSFHFEHDRDGRCIASHGDDGVLSVQLTYKPAEHETRVLDANGAEWVYQYTPAGVVTLITDPYGGVDFYKLGPDGRLLEQYDATGAKTTFVHNAEGAPVAKVAADGVQTSLPGPDARRGHRVPRLPIEMELGDAWDTDFTLPDDHEVLTGLLPAVRSGLETSNDPLRGASREVRNVQGLLLKEELEDGRARTYAYTETGSVRRRTDFDGGSTEAQYASWNHLVGVTDAEGRLTTYEHSATEKLTAVVDPSGTRSEYSYDLKDRLAQVSREGPVSGQLIRETYGYDAADRLIEKRDAKGERMLGLTWDHRGLLLERTLEVGADQHFRHDDHGQLTEAFTTEHKCTFAYDAAGRRTKDFRDGRGVERSFISQRLVRMAVLERFITRYRHRSDGTIELQDPTGAQHRIVSHGRGVFTREHASGLSEVSQYHPRGGRVLRRMAYDKPSGDVRWDRSFKYSGEGTLQEVRDERGTTRYEHDRAHRLQAELAPDGTRHEYEYNHAGALFRSPTLGQATVGKGNILRYANGEQFEYNERHHLAKRVRHNGEVSYDYDSRDQLNVVFWQGSDGSTWGWDAEYDGLGRRIRKSPGYTAHHQYYWDTDRLAAEVLPDGQCRVYVYADAFSMVPLMFVDYASVDAAPESGRRYYVFSDQRGCVDRIVDDGGHDVWRARIDPYGHAHIEVGAEFHQPLRFAGHFYDPELELSYNRFRYYSPQLGRYLQTDPWGLRGQGPNLYAYTYDPLTQCDVRGLGCGDDVDSPDGEPEGGPDQEDVPPAVLIRPIVVVDDDGNSVSRRMAEMREEGHGPQRHEGDVTSEQLRDRAIGHVDPVTGEGSGPIDPMTRTTEDGVHEGKTHRCGRHATRVTSEAAYVQADQHPASESGL